MFLFGRIFRGARPTDHYSHNEFNFYWLPKFFLKLGELKTTYIPIIEKTLATWENWLIHTRQLCVMRDKRLIDHVFFDTLQKGQFFFPAEGYHSFLQ